MCAASDNAVSVLMRKERSHSVPNEEALAKPLELNSLVSESKRAFLTAFRVTKSVPLAEDAVQEAYVVILRQAPLFRGEDHMRSFFLKVVHRRALLLMRTEGRRLRREELCATGVSLFTESTEENTQFNEVAHAARMSLNSLPLEERTAVSLCCEQGFTHEAAAEILGIPKSTLTRRVNRGLEKLRKVLARQGFSAVTPTAVGAALGSLPLPSVSPLLTAALQKLAANPSLAAKHPASISVKALSGASTKNVAAIVFWMTFVAVVAVAVFVGIWWSQSGGTPAGEASQVLALPIEKNEEASKASPAEISISWNFNDGKMPPEFEIIGGQCRVLSNGGPDGSGCLSIESPHAFIVLSIPVEKLPVVVSFQNQLLPPRMDGGYYAIARWERWTPPEIAFDNVGTVMQVIPYSWSKIACYVNETAFDQWIEGRRTLLNVNVRAQDARLGLEFRGRQLVDNIAIKSIEPDQAPEVRSYLTALAKVKPTGHFGKVILPDLKGGDPTKPVTATFCATKSSFVKETDIQKVETKK